MSKVFKTKKKKKKNLKIFIFIILICFMYQLTFHTLKDKSLVKTNEDFIAMMMTNSNYHLNYENSTFIDKIAKFVSNINVNKPITIIENGLGYTFPNKEKPVLAHKKEKTNYIKDPNPKKATKPLVYIYNSHQNEEYKAGNLSAHNITPNVMMAGYLLKEKLNKLDIPAIMEDSNVDEFLRINNWDHNDSYKATRIFLMDAVNKYKTPKLYIDLHRDAIDKNLSTITINKKKYAKVLFVIGVDNKNYKSNLKVASKLSELINKEYPGLSRGIMQKGGDGTNGIFNQDVNKQAILIECGAYKNTIDEVLKTTDALSVVIKKYIGDISG